MRFNTASRTIGKGTLQKQGSIAGRAEYNSDARADWMA
jgi:hypothetical protein